MTALMWFVLAVIMIPLLLVMFGRWRMDVAALFMVATLGLAQFLGLGVLGEPGNPADTMLAISGFSQPVVITLIALFVVTQALSENGAMRWFGERLGRAGAQSEVKMVSVFALASGILSLLMNNIAVGALMLPPAMAVSRRSKIKPSKILIPIAFGAALGGMATYFTTANIVISNLLAVAEPPQAPLGILSFALTGGLTALTGLAALALVGRHLLPDREPGPEQLIARRQGTELESLYAVGERLWEVRILPTSALVGETIEGSGIGAGLGIAIVAITRGRGTIFAPRSAEVIRAGDILLVVGRQDRVSVLKTLEVELGPEQKTLSGHGLTLVESVLAPHSSYADKDLKAINFRRKYNFSAIALLRRGRSFRTDVGDMPLEPGDALLLVGPTDRLRDLRTNADLILLETDPASRPIPRLRAIWSLLVLVGAIVASLLGLPVYLAMLAAATTVLITHLIPVQEAYRSMEWPVIIFVAGMSVASLAMVNTGLAAFVGQHTINALGITDPLELAGVAFLLAAALAQIMGSQATAFVIGPVTISAAIHLGTNPQAIAVATAIGCSAAFLTPTSHPVNILMMGPGNYRFGDFLRVGLVVMTAVLLALMAGMVLFWRL
jgi:di/tricarboxylate transporter